MAPDLAENIESGARDLLHGTIPGLAEKRAAERSKILLNQAALKGNMKKVERLGMEGDATAQEATGMARTVRKTSRREQAALRAAPATATEREAITSRALLQAQTRALPWYEQWGIPAAVGGTAGLAGGHSGPAALAAALATRGLLSPRVQSQSALMLANPMVQQLVRFGPLGLNFLYGAGFPPPDTTQNEPR
jgi:hypothetical protein